MLILHDDFFLKRKMLVMEIQLFSSPLIRVDGGNITSIITSFAIELLFIQFFQNMFRHTLFQKQTPQCHKVA